MEEETCYTCHSSLGIAETDVQAAFSSSQNSEGAFYSHPVAFTTGIHESSELETSSEDFSGDYRHVECVDCHNPHNATNLETDPPQLQSQVNGASGVEPRYSGPGAPLDFDWLDTAEFEYQLCFKCHSSFITLPTYVPAGWNGDEVIFDGLAKLTNSESQQVPDNRDMALEFNPFNASFHPVMALGRNLNIPADSFEEGWSAGSMVYCSDCHNNPAAEEQGSGPHGSRLHILNELSSYITVNNGTRMAYTGEEVCFACHRFETYVDSHSADQNTNFRRSNRNLHHTHSEDASCYVCHDSHGSEQLHLINLDASINNDQTDALVFYAGYDGQPTNSQTFWQISPDGVEKTCFISCHQHRHTSPGHSYTNYSLDPP
jgi:formate-dependent nitrite reductase cytochrome c552 subunit